MHRGNLPFLMLALHAPMLMLSLGCRNPFAANQVHVQPGPPTFSSQSDAPRSRLAGTASGDDARGISMSLGDQTQSQSQKSFPTLSKDEEQMLAEAYGAAGPEVRDLARRQFAAMKASGTATTNRSGKPATGAIATAGLIEGDARAATAARTTSATKPAPQPAPAAAPEKAAAESTAAQTPAADAPAPAPAAEPAPEQKPTPDSAVASDASEQADAAAAPAADAAEADALVADADAAAAQATPDASATDAEPSAESAPDAVRTVAATSETESDAVEDPLASASEAELLAALIDRYRSRVDAGGDEVSAAVALRTLQVLSGAPDEAVKPIEGWRTSEQEFLNYQMLALWQVLDPKAHPVRERRWSMALPELRQATTHLAAATGALEVRNLAFCTSVEGYGQLTPFEHSRFTPGQEVLLYVEVENFVAERLSDGYETHLQGTYEILDSEGRRVAHQVLPPHRESNNNYRRDYFIIYGMYLPQDLPAGAYRMQVTMEDVKGKTYGQSTIAFELTE